MGEILPVFKWTKKQEEALALINSTAMEILLYGGSRSAKTYLFCAYLCYRALYLEREFRAVILQNRLYGVIKKVGMLTLPDVMEKTFPGVYYHINQQRWFMNFDKNQKTGNRSTIWLAGISDSGNHSSLEKILGYGMHCAFFNEAQEVEWLAYQTVMTRIANKGLYPNKILVDCNPPPKQHWIYKRFILGRSPVDNTKVEGLRCASLLMNPIDNIENLDPEYLASLATMDRARQKRFLHGEFSESLEGGIFSKEMAQAEKDGRINDNIVYREGVPLHAVFDVGMGKVDKTACWLVHFYEGRIECIDYIQATQTQFQEFLKIIFDVKGYRL